MSGKRPSDRQDRPEEIDIERDRPHPARMYDYVLGGDTHFAADRALAEQMGEVLPGGLAFGRSLARRNRAFMARAVRFLAAEAGIRQFLDVGGGIPAFDNTHEIAQAVAPESRVVYVDYDPIVLAHAHERLRSTPEGACNYIHADFRDPTTFIDQAGTTLDFDQPIGLLLVAILHLVDDDHDPFGVTARLIDALPSGSYVLLSHFTNDIVTDEMTQMAAVYTGAGETMALRNHDEVTRFVTGLDLVEPGVTLIDEWRPDEDVDQPMPLYGVLAHKP